MVSDHINSSQIKPTLDSYDGCTW